MITNMWDYKVTKKRRAKKKKKTSIVPFIFMCKITL